MRITRLPAGGWIRPLKEVGEIISLFKGVLPMVGLAKEWTAEQVMVSPVVGSVSAERDITELVYLHEELSRASTQVRMPEKDHHRGSPEGKTTGEKIKVLRSR